MRYAIIQNTDVINVIDYDEQPNNPPPGFEEGIIAIQSDVAGPGWQYVDEEFVAPILPSPTPEELLARCKQIAKTLLQATDWATLSDVNLTNKDEFLTYRATLRNLVLNPVTSPEFPSEPTPIWSN
jgi:hypothetical protein